MTTLKSEIALNWDRPYTIRVPGIEFPKTTAGRIEYIIGLSEAVVRTGKRGRPRKMFKKEFIEELFNTLKKDLENRND